MRSVRLRLPLAALLLLLPAPAAAQLMAGLGPTVPNGRFNRDADIGVFAMARAGAGLLPLSLQFEASYAAFDLADAADGGDLRLRTVGLAGNAAAHLIRVGAVRPYAFGGLIAAIRRESEGSASRSSLRFGYQLGGGVDFALGPVKPFVEVRYVSVDGPGDVRDTHVPLLAGLRLF